MNSQGLGGEQRYVYGRILDLALVDGIVVGGVKEQGQLRGDFAVHQLGGSIQSLVVLVPLQGRWRIAASRATLKFEYGAGNEDVAIIVTSQQWR